MSAVLVFAIGAVLAAGLFLAMSRHLLRVVVGVSLIGAAANLMLFVSGRLGGTPPVIEAGLQALDGGTNPLPQALVLTAIVIGFALTCFSLILALAVRQSSDQGDADHLVEAEPPAGSDGMPAVLDDAPDREPRA
ncbi:sodium:proton antiporter [Luteimonas abyssi]|uniref:sodium:proton antiporter n=1 Tax=Luteimonas abyssi TaxID=1247514 RepID=UPI000737CB75|nr:NADH-quinone oxidoreductase subunit K [Luteimonas abyssi]